MIRQAARFSFGACAIALVGLVFAPALEAQRNGGAAGPLPSIEEKTAGMERMDGMLPLYWDADQGQLWMEIPQLDVEMIHFVGYGAGLGSNDLGLDRGALRGEMQAVAPADAAPAAGDDGRTALENAHGALLRR